MSMTMIEKILASRSRYKMVEPGQIIDIKVDIKVAREHSGENLIKQIEEQGFELDHPRGTFFTFDHNPVQGIDEFQEKRARCRSFAENRGIQVIGNEKGIGTHALIDLGHVFPGSVAISPDPHVNIIGAIGAYGYTATPKELLTAWTSGVIWVKVPVSVKLTLAGDMNEKLSSKDLALNLLKFLGNGKLAGQVIEIHGAPVEELTLDDRITLCSMANEMGLLSILIPPSPAILASCRDNSNSPYGEAILPDSDCTYHQQFTIDISSFKPVVLLPGLPAEIVDAELVTGTALDAVHIGSCTNGRKQDMAIAGQILKGKKVKEGLQLIIVPATEDTWIYCEKEGLMDIFLQAGARVLHPGCLGCYPNRPSKSSERQVIASTGNRNIKGMMGVSDIILCSPRVAAASAIAGYLATPWSTIPRIYTLPDKNARILNKE